MNVNARTLARAKCRRLMRRGVSVAEFLSVAQGIVRDDLPLALDEINRLKREVKALRAELQEGKSNEPVGRVR